MDKAIQTQTKIGKDVLDSITISMYEDPRIIYREYIQNSADQIDIALSKGILRSKDSGIIEIKIDPNKGSILIEDNATGIESLNVENVLKNVAQSSKKRDTNKGFRGIGRLGGIAYCEKLVFETSYSGEKIKSVLTWDASRLKNIINDRSKNEDAVEVIDAVTSIEQTEEIAEKHYFKVSLLGVENSTLLNVGSVRMYLSMVAPVPYQRHFIFKNVIYDHLKDKGLSIDEYEIYINNDKLEKAYTTSIYEGQDNERKRIDEITELKFFPVEDSEGKLLAYGWYGISNFEKQIPSVNIARGLRFRKGNIQIGNNDTLIRFFKQQRGNNYFFGEIFVLDNGLIPNARRDYFVENETLESFEILLTKKLRNPLYELYYYASNVKSASKKIEQLDNFRKEYEKKSNKTGFSNKDEKEKYAERYTQLQEAAKKGEEKLNKLKEKITEPSDPKQKIFENITKAKPKLENLKKPIEAKGKPKFATDELSKLRAKDRKLVSKIFGVIDNVLTPDLASNLKDKIKEEFK